MDIRPVCVDEQVMIKRCLLGVSRTNTDSQVCAPPTVFFRGSCRNNRVVVAMQPGDPVGGFARREFHITQNLRGILGQKVAPAQARPGDLLCYGPGGNQSVALYLGNNQMIEGTSPAVSVSPARTSNMVPYLTRVLSS